MVNCVIQAQNLSKSYGKKKILDDISFTLPSGIFCTLLGHNGAGKSTLLRLVAGAEFADEGETFFKSVSTQAWSNSNKKDIFYINENIVIETALTMENYAKVFSEFFPRWDQDFFKQMADERKISLNKNYHNYSRGQKMQVNLMMAIAANPELLLLDEITSVMDVYARRYFLSHLSKFTKKGQTVIMTTNIISELQMYTDHLMLVQDSKLAINAPMNEVKKDFIKLRFSLGSDHPLLKNPKLIWTGLNNDQSASYILSIQEAVKIVIPEELVDRRSVTLEDIFIFYFTSSHKWGQDARAA